MLSLSHTLFSAGIVMFTVGAGILTHDAVQLHACRRAHDDAHSGTTVALDPFAASPKNWRTSLALTLLAWSPLVISAALLVALAG